MGTLKRNFTFAFGAQGLQFFQSMIWSLLIPKLMGVEQFGYWQLFIFYTQYGGFLSFGLIDGTFLNIGGKEYKNLNYSFLGFQLRAFIFWQIVILAPIVIYSFFNLCQERVFIIAMSSLYIIIYNIMGYLMYVLQAVNNIKCMTFGRMLTSAFFIFSILVLLFLRTSYFQPYVICYFLCNGVCLIYYMAKMKDIVRNVIPTNSEHDDFNLMLRNMKVGFVLLISNICGMLVLGFGRFMVDEVWGIKAFSVVSFAFMFINFFMTFIQQGSLVLFPELRRWEYDKIRSFYIKMRKIISVLFPVVLLAYAPICYFVEFWLPQYIESVKYLLYLLPLCIFDTKMNLLCNTLFKVYNRVNSLLICNILALLSSVFGILISLFIIKSMVAVVIAMLLAIVIRSIFAEVLLSKIIDTSPVWKNISIELCLLTIFVISNVWLGINWAFVLYFIIISLHFYNNRKELKRLIAR